MKDDGEIPPPPPIDEEAKMARYIVHYSGNKLLIDI